MNAQKKRRKKRVEWKGEIQQTKQMNKERKEIKQIWK